MKKGVLSAMLMAIVVALGFFLPSQLLAYKQEALYDAYTTKDLSAQLVLKQESDLIGKLTLLHDPNAVVAGVTISDSEASQAYELLLSQFEALSEYGYRSVPIYLDEFGQNYYAFEQIYVDQMRVLRAYVIQGDTAFAVIDKESHRILQLGSRVAPLERIADVLNMKEGDERLFVKNLRAFAKYYGLSFGKVSMSEVDIFGSDAGAVISASMYDEDGGRLDFGLFMDSSEGFCYVGAVAPSEQAEEFSQYDAGPIQSVKESDAE